MVTFLGWWKRDPNSKVNWPPTKGSSWVTLNHLVNYIWIGSLEMLQLNILRVMGMIVIFAPFQHWRVTSGSQKTSQSLNAQVNDVEGSNPATVDMVNWCKWSHDLCIFFLNNLQDLDLVHHFHVFFRHRHFFYHVGRCVCHFIKHATPRLLYQHVSSSSFFWWFDWVHWIRSSRVRNMSNEKALAVCRVYRGWNTTQLYGDYNKPLPIGSMGLVYFPA